MLAETDRGSERQLLSAKTVNKTSDYFAFVLVHQLLIFPT